MEKRKSFHIRDARDDEREAMRDVTLAAYEEYAAVMPKPFWDGYQRQLLVTLDEKGPVERIVAEREGTIIGSVLLYPPLANAYTGVSVGVGWPEVRLLAVSPGARGEARGIRASGRMRAARTPRGGKDAWSAYDGDDAGSHRHV